MSDRTPSQAVTRYTDVISRVLSCVIAQAVPLAERNVGVRNRLRLPQRMYWLRGTRTILFSYAEEYRIVTDGDKNGPWRVQPAAYIYQLYAERREELLAFHWHPETPGPAWFPHVHVRSDAAPLSHKVHLPTGGVVALADVVRLLIVEFGVPPLRKDWQAIISNEQ